jgi:putative oxidoreductase
MALIARRSLPRPDLLALAVGWTELLGGAALLVGLLTRAVTLPLAIVLLVAIAGYKWEQGFLGGWDWPFSVLGIVLAIALIGAGPVSLDALLQVPLT